MFKNNEKKDIDEFSKEYAMNEMYDGISNLLIWLWDLIPL